MGAGALARAMVFSTIILLFCRQSALGGLHKNTSQEPLARIAANLTQPLPNTVAPGGTPALSTATPGALMADERAALICRLPPGIRRRVEDSSAGIRRGPVKQAAPHGGKKVKP